VRRRGFSGQGFTWVDGHFKEVHGKGAFVITAKDGNSNFYHWNEIEVSYEKAAPPSFAKLGDALLARIATPDRSQIAVAPPPPPPPPKPKAAPVTLTRQRAPSSPHRHTPTKVGAALRSAREDSGQSQADAAKALGLSATRLSNIETGAILPTADDLVLFAALYDLPLRELEALGDAPAPASERPPPAERQVPAASYVMAIAAVIEALAPLTIAERRALLQPLLRIL
jgi:transcriptional regulator with XRE-family HTH domain